MGITNLELQCPIKTKQRRQGVFPAAAKQGHDDPHGGEHFAKMTKAIQVGDQHLQVVSMAVLTNRGQPHSQRQKRKGWVPCGTGDLSFISGQSAKIPIKGVYHEKVKKITALLLVTVMCTAMTATAFAVQPFSDEDRWTTNARGELVYIVGDEVDDTPLKIEPQTASATGSTLLFEMILKEMYHDLHTTGASATRSLRKIQLG